MYRLATRHLLGRAAARTSTSTSRSVAVHPSRTAASSATAASAVGNGGGSGSQVMVAAPPGDGPNHRSLMSLDGNSIRPHVQPNSFAAPSASVIGSVAVNDKAYVGYGVVVRGDLALIHVGFNSIVGDNCVLTAGAVVDGGSSPPASNKTLERSRAPTPSDAVATGLSIDPELIVGDFCQIGANSHLHGCFLDGDNHVGANCVIEQGARMERYSALLPNSTLPPGTTVPTGQVWAGSPASQVDSIHPDYYTPRRQVVVAAYHNTYAHMYEFLPVGTPYWEKEELAKKK